MSKKKTSLNQKLKLNLNPDNALIDLRLMNSTMISYVNSFIGIQPYLMNSTMISYVTSFIGILPGMFFIALNS